MQDKHLRKKKEEQDPGSILSFILLRNPEKNLPCADAKCPSLLATQQSDFQRGCPGGYVLPLADKEPILTAYPKSSTSVQPGRVQRFS